MGTASVVALVLALVVVASKVDAGSTAFASTLLTMEDVGFDASTCPAEPFVTGRTTGRGRAIGIGAVTGVGVDCIHPTTSSTFAFRQGRFTLTTAEGDEIRAEYDGDLIPSPLPYVQLIAGRFRITGGTGRFADADGAGIITGIEHLAIGEGVMQMAGSISRRPAGSP